MRVISAIVGIVVGFIIWGQSELQFAHSAQANVQNMSRYTLSAPSIIKLSRDNLYRLSISVLIMAVTLR